MKAWIRPSPEALLFPLLLCSLLALSSTVREQCQSPLLSSPLPVEVQTGRSPYCSGRGLCSIQAQQEKETSNQFDAVGLLALSSEGNFLLKLPRENLRAGMEEEQMMDGKFELPEPLPLPQDVRNTFSTYPLDHIPAGRYRTNLTTDTLYIFFE